MFHVSIREYFSVLNVFIVCTCNTTMFKLIHLLCTHVYSYMFRTLHPPRNSVGLLFGIMQPVSIVYGHEPILPNSPQEKPAHIVDLDDPNILVECLQERAQFFKRAMLMVMENLSII